MKNTINITWVIITIVIVILTVLMFAKNSKPKNVEVIKIGSVLSLTGPAAQESKTLQEGIDMAVVELKSKGIPIEVIYQDDATDPKKAVSATQFLGAKHVDGIVGLDWDFIYNSASPTLDQMKTVGITVTNSSEYTTPSEYGFHMAPKTVAAKDNIEQWLRENNIKTISFVASKFAWSDVYLSTLKAAAKNTDTTITSENWIQFGEESEALKTIIPKVQQEKPDAVFAILGGDSALFALFKNIEQFQLHIPVIAGTTVIGTFLQTHPEVLTNYPVYSIIPAADDDFIKKYQKKYGNSVTPGEYTLYAYNATNLLVKAIIDSREQNIDLRAYLLRMKQFDENRDYIIGDWQIVKNR